MSDIFNDVINALQCLDERLFKWFVNHQNKEKIDKSRLIANGSDRGEIGISESIMKWSN